MKKQKKNLVFQSGKKNLVFGLVSNRKNELQRVVFASASAFVAYFILSSLTYDFYVCVCVCTCHFDEKTNHTAE